MPHSSATMKKRGHSTPLLMQEPPGLSDEIPPSPFKEAAPSSSSQQRQQPQQSQYACPNVFAVLSGIILMVGLSFFTSNPELPNVRVAFIGNSMIYFNDFPRFMESLSDGLIQQNGCLHGNSNLSSILQFGSGMYDKWQTGPALVEQDDDTYPDIYDYGACSVQQLLFGTDDILGNSVYYEYSSSGQQSYYYYNGYDNTTMMIDDDDESIDVMMDDGENPCIQDPNYYDYLQQKYETDGPPQWDFILINDNTRNPCCTDQRAGGKEMLTDVYMQWFLKTGATPIFMSTFAYWADTTRDMSGLVNVPTFTSLTYQGYMEYVELVAEYLPPEQKPRLAPVGLAFLTVWEENYALWQGLIHYDDVHPSPSGTFLQGCVVYATIFGKMPPASILNSDSYFLFRNARRMVPSSQKQKPYPTEERMRYLYNVAKRVMDGHVPESFIKYKDQESVYFHPNDSLYSQ
jgi:hypothetical protein